MVPDLSALRDAEIRGRRTFTVAREHATNVFGEQADPPGLPAAADATAEESIRVLGSPHLLAACEFTARQSLRGHRPEGTGTVGESAELARRRAAPLGAEVVVEATLERVDSPRLELRGRVARANGPDPDDRERECERDPEGGDRSDASDAVVGTVGMTFRVVERDRFRAAVE